MLSWIVRLFFALAAPITALFIARDALNFDLIQTMVAIILVVVLIAVVAFWSKWPRSEL